MVVVMNTTAPLGVGCSISPIKFPSFRNRTLGGVLMTITALHEP